MLVSSRGIISSGLTITQALLRNVLNVELFLGGRALVSLHLTLPVKDLLSNLTQGIAFH
jgi:hypothetical protein